MLSSLTAGTGAATGGGGGGAAPADSSFQAVLYAYAGFGLLARNATPFALSVSTDNSSVAVAAAANGSASAAAGVGAGEVSSGSWPAGYEVRLYSPAAIAVQSSTGDVYIAEAGFPGVRRVVNGTGRIELAIDYSPGSWDSGANSSNNSSGSGSTLR